VFLRRWVLFSVVLASFAAFAPSAFAADKLPDLQIAPLRDIYVQNTSDGRRLLRFTTIIVNRGAGPFEVRGSRLSTSQTEMSVTHRIYQTEGGYRTIATPAKMFYAGDGHNHWHVRDLQTYVLIRIDNGGIAGTGAKRGFCFYDNYRDNLSLPGAPQSPVYTTCGTSSSLLAVTTGLSIGWGDVYPHDIAYQYIDITGITSGRYLLKATADPSDWFLESNQSNNTTSTELELTGSSASADLSASIADSPDPVTVGSDLTYTITVRNGGSQSASDVKVTDTIPSAATYVSVSPSQGSCTGPPTVTCSLGSLGNGATATVRLVVRPTTAGALSNSASVSSSTTDPSSGNNSATATTTVNATAPPPPPPPPSTTVTAFPGSTYLFQGSVRSGGATNLGADDNSFFEVNSSGGVTYWYGRFNNIPNSLQNLQVASSSLASANCTQSLRLWNWTSGYWVTLDTRTLGPTEVGVTATAGGTLANYVSGSTGNGDVAVALRCSSFASFFTSTDLLKITYSIS
jgi:uncharacterized repeat protein (TIGR01451 family)